MPLKVVLINPYELGRQPFALAEAAAWLAEAGFSVKCTDLSLQKLDSAALAEADMVAVYLGMHTATRIAMEALPRIRELAPSAHLCAYGLYAPMNEQLLRDLGISTIIGGEPEPALLELSTRLSQGEQICQTTPDIRVDKIQFAVPRRDLLPDLERYAHLILPSGEKRVVGFAEGTRGCKHFCRHCPVVPIYEGKFRVIPVAVVMADIRQQIAAGARHISFGDPDFFNGPTHAMNIVRELHHEFPDVTYDAVIKIQHLINHADLLPQLKQTGCLFITAAVESVDDQILDYLLKNHTHADYEKAVALCREAEIAIAPTFVAFNPWITLEGYIDLLQSLVELKLVEAVPPIQLTIRLLIPAGSHLLQLPGFTDCIGPFDPAILGHPWHHPDPKVDRLQKAVQDVVANGEKEAISRREIFERVWHLAHEMAGKIAPSLSGVDFGSPIPHMSEPWYCCAEPTNQQLQSF